MTVAYTTSWGLAASSRALRRVAVAAIGALVSLAVPAQAHDGLVPRERDR